MKHFLFALVLPLLLVACENGAQKIADKHDEVMVVHDEAMAKMDQIYDQISDLRVRQQSLTGIDSIVRPEDMAQVLDAIVALQRADDAMMDWMAAYKRPEEDADVEESLAYLEGQMEEIEQVAVDIDASLENGAAVLEKFKHIRK